MFQLFWYRAKSLRFFGGYRIFGPLQGLKRSDGVRGAAKMQPFGLFETIFRPKKLYVMSQ